MISKMGKGGVIAQCFALLNILPLATQLLPLLWLKVDLVGGQNTTLWQWDLWDEEYMSSMNRNTTVFSRFKRCREPFVFRKTYGNLDLRTEAYAVPLHWSSYLSVKSTMNNTNMFETFELAGGIYPEIILPFVFIICVLAVAGISFFPVFILGFIGAIFVFNLRILAHKNIRRTIRTFLIKREKYRRWKFERSFPLQHLRKFRERDRYHLPKAFQNSDLESDDEPLELMQSAISRQKTTMWAPAEIEMLGFDPDNIPMEVVYGDLLGYTDMLSPEVKRYIRKKRENPDMEKKGMRKGSQDSDDPAMDMILQKAAHAGDGGDTVKRVESTHKKISGSGSAVSTVGSAGINRSNKYVQIVKNEGTESKQHQLQAVNVSSQQDPQKTLNAKSETSIGKTPSQWARPTGGRLTKPESQDSNESVKEKDPKKKNITLATGAGVSMINPIMLKSERFKDRERKKSSKVRRSQEQRVSNKSGGRESVQTTQTRRYRGSAPQEGGFRTPSKSPKNSQQQPY